MEYLILTAKGSKYETSKETVYRSTLEPHKDLIDRLQVLEPQLLDILELDDNYNVTITGLTIKHEDLDDGRMGLGCVISGQKELECSDAPFCMNTPFISQKKNESTGSTLSMGLNVKIEMVIDEVIRYMNGKTRQMKMNLGLDKTTIDEVSITTGEVKEDG